MKRKKLFKKTGSWHYRPIFREYMERQFDMYGAQYTAAAVLLAAAAILLQAIWFIHSLLK